MQASTLKDSLGKLGCAVSGSGGQQHSAVANAAKQVLQQIRDAITTCGSELTRIQMAIPKVAQALQARGFEEKDMTIVQAMITEIQEKAVTAEGLVEKAGVCFAALSEAADDELEQMRSAVEQTESAVKQAQTAISSTLALVGSKQSAARHLKATAAQSRANAELYSTRERLQQAHTKLQTMKNVRVEFNQRITASTVSKELLTKISPLEIDLDRAEAAAHQLRLNTSCPEALKATEQSLAEASVKLNEAQRLCELRMKAAMGLVKKELERLEERIRACAVRFNDLKTAPQMVQEAQSSEAIVRDASVKLQAAEEAVSKVETTLGQYLVDPSKASETPVEAMAAIKQSEQETTAAGKATTSARVAISTSLVEVRRYSKEHQLSVQTQLTEFKIAIEAAAKRLADVRSSSAEVKRQALLGEVEHRVAIAEDNASKLSLAAGEFRNDADPAETRVLAAALAKAATAAMEAMKTARELMIRRQIEAKGRDAPDGLTDLLHSLQARLRTAESEIHANKKLPVAAEEQVKLLAKVEDVLTRVKDAEAKVEKAMLNVDAATKFATNLEVPQQSSGADPANAADLAIQTASLAIKASLRHLEAQAKMSPEVQDSIMELKPRLEEAQKQLDAGTAQVRSGDVLRKAAALVREAEPKVVETDRSMMEVEEASAPLLKLIQEESTDEKAVNAALLSAERSLTVAHSCIGRTRSCLATKKIAMSKYPEGSTASAADDLAALIARADGHANRLQEIRKTVNDRKYAAGRTEAAEKMAEVEENVALSVEAGKTLENDVDEQAAAKVHGMADASILGTRTCLHAQLKVSKDQSVTNEIQQMLDKVKTFEQTLLKEKQRLSERKQGVAARGAIAKSTDLFVELDSKIAAAEAIAAPLISGKKEKLGGMIALMQVVDLVREHMKTTEKSITDVFQNMSNADTAAAAVTEESFVSFVEELLAVKDGPKKDACALTKVQIKAAFTSLDCRGTGKLSASDFVEHFSRCFTVANPCAMTEHLSVRTGKIVCRLEVGEKLICIGDPKGEEAFDEVDSADDLGTAPTAGLRRLHTRREKTGAEGWVSLASNQGTVYLQAHTPHEAMTTAVDVALKEALEACAETQAFLRRESEKMQNARSGPLADVRAELTKMRVRASKAQQAHADIKKRVFEARRRYSEQLEKYQRQQQEASDRVTAERMVKEATAMADEAVAEVDRALSVAETILANKASDKASPLVAMTEAEKALEAAQAAVTKALEKVGKTDFEKVRNTSSAPFVEARRGLLKQKVRLSPYESRTAKQLAAVSAARSRLASDAREAVAEALRAHTQKKDITYEALYKKLLHPSEAHIPVESFRDFIKSIAEPTLTVGQLDLGLEGLAPGVTKLGLQGLMQEYLKCVKEVALTSTLEVSRVSSTVRKLELNEVVQVIGARTRDEGVGLERQRCRALVDGAEGWVTLRGNQGTSFMKSTAKPYYRCTADTVMQPDFDPTSTELRLIRVGEVLAALEGPRKAPAVEVSRIKGKATKDGKIGWITQKCTTGSLHLEEKQLLNVTKSTVLTSGLDVSSASTVRKLEIGESLEAIGEMVDDSAKGISRLMVKARRDGMEGWATMKGSHGTAFLEETVVSYISKCGVALQSALATSSKTLRLLEEGELFEVIEGPKSEILDGPVRARGRVIGNDGDETEGWFTMANCMEAWSPTLRCKNATDLFDSAERGFATVIRTLQLGETMEVVEAPPPGTDKMLRIRAKKDGALGFAASHAPKGDTIFEPLLEEM
eukprot:TRINITY_DN11627_c4_g1_i1.p1 TRINITY_DN11627_c4_g1~~TRINITY_DN11627_c4_g1_i1.p1  ORF type:complete len:2037 (-),score=496.11 TRINITY_DN11627_c4_g1_i1:386-5647(-)